MIGLMKSQVKHKIGLIRFVCLCVVTLLSPFALAFMGVGYTVCFLLLAWGSHAVLLRGETHGDGDA